MILYAFINYTNKANKLHIETRFSKCDASTLAKEIDKSDKEYFLLKDIMASNLFRYGERESALHFAQHADIGLIVGFSNLEYADILCDIYNANFEGLNIDVMTPDEIAQFISDLIRNESTPRTDPETPGLPPPSDE